MNENIKKVIGIIGAGQMGSGIAHVCALAGYQVVLLDRDKEKALQGLKNIEKNLHKQLKAKPAQNNQVQQQVLARIQCTDELIKLADSSIVIEAVLEDEKLKTEVFFAVQKIISPECILTSNTSSISITRLAAATDRPDKFMGLHFMNPVPVMKLVELIRGIATSDETCKTITAFVDEIGKISVMAEDFPAFIVNRILVPMLNEAVYTLYEGVGDVQSIDNAMKLGTNHPMGPLQLADFVGLDICLAIMQVLYDGLADSKYRPCPLLIKYVDAGWLGVKTGKGFYDYSFNPPKPTR